ncbi:hypothetical protein OF83DRAFT_1178976 [Amylostereum chailletii]|nr:hypothetical protein OF83DRAFT_1178976 [Amylostereum chailletii]
MPTLSQRPHVRSLNACIHLCLPTLNAHTRALNTCTNVSNTHTSPAHGGRPSYHWAPIVLTQELQSCARTCTTAVKTQSQTHAAAVKKRLVQMNTLLATCTEHLCEHSHPHALEVNTSIYVHSISAHVHPHHLCMPALNVPFLHPHLLPCAHHTCAHAHTCVYAHTHAFNPPTPVPSMPVPSTCPRTLDAHAHPHLAHACVPLTTVSMPALNLTKPALNSPISVPSTCSHILDAHAHPHPTHTHAPSTAAPMYTQSAHVLNIYACACPP